MPLTPSSPLRLITRSSPLALIQSHLVIKQLQQHYPDQAVELISVSSTGDEQLQTSLSSFSTTGIFVKKLEQGLLDKTADFAVHSLKDMPAPLNPKFTFTSYLKRESPYDLIISKEQDILNSDNGDKIKVIGTSSQRRRYFLQQKYPKWQFKEIRGNINTRLKKLTTSEYDAIVLAEAGINRFSNSPEFSPDLLGGDNPILNDFVITPLPTSLVTPAPGQGCIVIECLSERQDLIKHLKPLNHSTTELSVTIERKIMETMGGGCHTPFGCLVEVDKTIKTIANHYFTEEQRLTTAKLETAFEQNLGAQSKQNLIAEITTEVIKKLK